VIRQETGGEVGFYIADSRFFESYRKTHPAVDEVNPKCILKEWEIIASSRNEIPNMDFLKKKENEIGDPVLWNALVADRRIYLGKRATLEQDYRPRFTHSEMLSILQVAVRQIGELFDRLQPDAVVGFICVTIGEYLAYLEARARNILFVNLRPTRIRNFFYGGESIFEPSPRLIHRYNEMIGGGVPKALEETAKQIVASTRKTHAMYEGVLPVSDNKQPLHLHNGWKNKLHRFHQIPGDFWDCNFGSFRHDTTYKGTLHPYYYKYVRQPIRKKIYDYFLKTRYVRQEKLPQLRYAFYPLHKEPEVTLLVYSRPYLNQIEVIRNIAHSLPVDMKLLVKEHPACVGYRPLNYYRKLIEIPNVVLAPPETDSRSLVKHATVVCIVSGSIGLEALIMKKPVIHFGRVPFEALPDCMIRRVIELEQTAAVIGEMLLQHQHDEASLIAYICAVIELSVSIDFYSVLLGRQGVYRPVSASGKDSNRNMQLIRLATYIADIALPQRR